MEGLKRIKESWCNFKLFLYRMATFETDYIDSVDLSCNKMFNFISTDQISSVFNSNDSVTTRTI